MFFAYLSLRDEIFDYHNTFVIRFEDWAYAASGLSGVSILLRLVQILVSLVRLSALSTDISRRWIEKESLLSIRQAHERKEIQQSRGFESLIIGFREALSGLA